MGSSARCASGRACCTASRSGVDGDKVHQKRIPPGAPDWVQTVRVHFPRYGRHADELCVTELASVIWAVQMSTVEFHPWNSRRADVERPDEWRIDIDPMPDCPFDRVQRVAHVAHEVLDELGVVGWPKTSGGSGIHVYVRIEPRWGFGDVRRAALAFAREVERRAPDDATTAWWRKDREPDKAFVDYNQNARDHTIASAYSVRGVSRARSRPRSAWDELDDVESARAEDRHRARALRRPRRPARRDRRRAFSLEPLLEWADGTSATGSGSGRRVRRDKSARLPAAPAPDVDRQHRAGRPLLRVSLGEKRDRVQRLAVRRVQHPRGGRRRAPTTAGSNPPRSGRRAD